MPTVSLRAWARTAAASVLLAAPAAAKKPLTIDVLMNEGAHAQHGSVTWSPDGMRFVHEDSGRVMLYDPATRQDTELFNLGALEHAAAPVPEKKLFGWQNRRVTEQSIEWSGNGEALLLAVKGDLFLWRFAAKEWEQLTHTPEAEADPKISPDARSVVFRRAQDLYRLDTASKAVIRLTTNGSPTLLNGELDWVYPEELEIGTAVWWSPDSKRIAYLQFDVSKEFVYPQVVLTGVRALLEPERYPQAGTANPDVRLGVIGIDDPAPATRWMDTGPVADALLARIDWLRDSQHIAIQRMNRIQNRLDLLIADVQSGSSRTIFHEEDKYWVNVSDAYAFLRRSDEFVWSSERDGYRHLYLYANDGRLERRLTEGSWQVTTLLAADERTRRVWFLSTEASPLERQLYTVSFDGGAPTRVTQAPGTHAINMSSAGGYWLDDFSSTRSPHQTSLRGPDGTPVTVWEKQDRGFLDAYEMPGSEVVKIPASDGTPLYGKLIRPAGFQTGRRYPLVVMVYGGPQAQVVRDEWHLGLDESLASRGFLVWMLDNRGSAARGHVFETPLFRRFGRTELEDQVTGVKYLIARGLADPKRVGIYGWSYGGFMTLYALLHAPDVFQAGVAGAPVTNWHNYDTIYTERYLGLPAENEEGYKLSSPFNDAASLRGRLLILHNMEDDNVLFQNSMQMADALERAGKQFAMVVYPQKSHGVEGEVRRQLMETQAAFFERELK